MSMPLNERIATLINHAEAFADEATDIERHDIADRLRLGASRLAIDGELVDDALKTLSTKQVDGAVARGRLRACLHRVEIELANRSVHQAVSSSLAASRVSILETARFRLRRLTPAQHAQLGPLVPALQAAVSAVDDAVEACLSATERHCIADACARGRMWRLRLDCERAKAALLEVLPPTSAEAARVRRRVVRTRRPDARSVFISKNSTDGEPIG